MTVVFDDEELYTNLKVEAARNHCPAKDIVSTALELYFEATPDEQDAILRRSRMKGYGRASGPSIEHVLEEIGLGR